MISDKLLRNSTRVSDIELGLNSYASFAHKKSVHTEASSNEDQDNHTSSGCPAGHESRHACGQTETTINELRLKLLKLSDRKANMQLRYKKQIILMNNELQVMNAEGQMLSEVIGQVKNNIQEMKTDLQFVKKCVENKQLRLSISPNFTKNMRQDKLNERHSPRNKPSKLFNPNMVKNK